MSLPPSSLDTHADPEAAAATGSSATAAPAAGTVRGVASTAMPIGAGDAATAAAPQDAALDWPRIEWVLLDMDGTILDLAYDTWFWRTHVPEQYAAARGLSVDDALAALQPTFEGLAHTLPWYCTDHWSRVTGLDIAGLKRASRSRVSVLAGAEAFLQAVRDSGRKLWLATNAHADSWGVKLEHTGIAHYFEHILCSHSYGAPKESQDFWDGIQATHPFVKERALFVDDSLPVLRAALTYGIGQVRAIAKPASDQPARVVTGLPAVAGLVNLLPSLLPLPAVTA